MPNARDATLSPMQRILLVGETGSGKSVQMWTLPGRVFCYVFDPNTLTAIAGSNVQYEVFAPDYLELDASIKGFNKGARSDTTGSKHEPLVYMNWVRDMNERVRSGYFKDFDWICFDSLTFLSQSMMNRQKFLNNRYGDIEELGDFRIIGSKIADVFCSIAALPHNIFATGHLQTYQDEKTKRVDTQLQLPGRARNQLPLLFTNLWLAQAVDNGKGGVRYEVRTKPDDRGLRTIRSGIRGLQPNEDVTIPAFDDTAMNFGIGKLLKKRS